MGQKDSEEKLEGNQVAENMAGQICTLPLLRFLCFFLALWHDDKEEQGLPAALCAVWFSFSSTHLPKKKSTVS